MVAACCGSNEMFSFSQDTLELLSPPDSVYASSLQSPQSHPGADAAASAASAATASFKENPDASCHQSSSQAGGNWPPQHPAGRRASWQPKYHQLPDWAKVVTMWPEARGAAAATAHGGGWDHQTAKDQQQPQFAPPENPKVQAKRLVAENKDLREALVSIDSKLDTLKRTFVCCLRDLADFCGQKSEGTRSQVEGLTLQVQELSKWLEKIQETVAQGMTSSANATTGEALVEACVGRIEKALIEKMDSAIQEKLSSAGLQLRLEIEKAMAVETQRMMANQEQQLDQSFSLLSQRPPCFTSTPSGMVLSAASHRPEEAMAATAGLKNLGRGRRFLTTDTERGLRSCDETEDDLFA